MENIKFDEKGLIPAVVQDEKSGEVLMVAYMNEESLELSKKTGHATFWSRSRSEIWEKGATSGNFMNIKEMRLDCDNDCILVLVDAEGPACHTGKRTCFFKGIDGEEIDLEKKSSNDILLRLMAVTQDRKINPQEGSYTNYLFNKGEDKILKKVGEEAAEVVIAGKNRDKDEISYEVADLMYHLTVMLADNDMTWEDIFDELEKRR